MINIPNLDGLDEPTRAAFEALLARLRGFLATSFDEDGNVLTAPPAGSVEVGMVFDYVGGVPPNRYLVCDGSAVSRVTYKALFERQGTTFGAGDGSTTFNLPDCRGRATYGKATAGTGSTLGSTFGSMDHTHSVGTHTHSISAAAAHTHTGSTSSDGSHSHSQGAHRHAIGSGSTVQDTGDGVGPQVFYSATQIDILDDSGTGSAGSHSHTVSLSSDGGHDHGGVTGSSGAATSGTGNPPGIVFTKMIYVGVETT